MTIWYDKVTPADINARLKDTLCEHLNMEITEIGDDYLEGTMPFNNKTRQPFNHIHGGASVALAETLGSIGGNLCVAPPQYCVGMEINANHIASVSEGYVRGRTTPAHIGRTTHVWEINLYREDGRLFCISRHTLAVKSFKC